MRDITKYTIERTVEALKENEDRIPIIADNPLLGRYPHGYYEPGHPPVCITPALAPTFESELNEDGSISDITVPELAYEDYDIDEDEDTTGQYVSQSVNPVLDEHEQYIEWFNEVINGYSIDPEFNVDDVDTDFEYDDKEELDTEDFNIDEFDVEFMSAEDQREALKEARAEANTDNDE